MRKECKIVQDTVAELLEKGYIKETYIDGITTRYDLTPAGMLALNGRRQNANPDDHRTTRRR